jgi:hypothetical protein
MLDLLFMNKIDFGQKWKVSNSIGIDVKKKIRFYNRIQLSLI